jgi:transcriptional regulator with XRE-family HTH domain
METYGERLKYAIKESKRQSKEIAESLGMNAGYLSSICSGKAQASDTLTEKICRELGLNRQWLMTGKGDMHEPEDRIQAIARLTNDVLKDSPESFRNRLIIALSKLDAQDWDTLSKIADDLLLQQEKREEP